MSVPPPQVSLVATSRNDDHGGSMLYRMQHFIDGYVYQFNKFNVPSELIIVDWNPPTGRPPLAEVLKIPPQLGCCQVRFITFPAELHNELPHGAELPLFQMIAKNVGIRRAAGRLIAATNIDILFSDDMMRELQKPLEKGFFYRADRNDVPHELPETPDYKQILDFCRREEFRINALEGTYSKINQEWIITQPIGKIVIANGKIIPDHNITLQFSKLIAMLRQRILDFFHIFRIFHIFRPRRWGLLLTASFWRAAPQRAAQVFMRTGSSIKTTLRSFKHFIKLLLRLVLSLLQRLLWPFQNPPMTLHLHTNACGDFTMLARDDWFRLRGYLEWPIFSWNLDSVLLYQAHFNGIRQRILNRAPVYHIEHGKGSGYTPEGAETLFKRIEAKGIPYMDWPGFLIEIKKMHQLSEQKQPVTYNLENWGYADHDLAEVVFTHQN